MFQSYHVCQICRVVHDSWTELKLHYAIDHPPMPRWSKHERKFLCDLCPEKFTTRRFLAKHMKEQHDVIIGRLKRPTIDPQCEICDKKLADASSLRTHMISIHGVAPQRRYRVSTQSRIRQAGKEPPGSWLSCPECGRGFSKMYNARNHLVTVHEKSYWEARNLLARENAKKLAKKKAKNTKTETEEAQDDENAEVEQENGSQ